MTEQEAKTKACCKGAATPNHSGNCIGSARMAWRNSPVFMTQVNEKGETVQSEGRSYSDFYCGLAGKP